MKRKDYLLDTNILRYVFELRCGGKSSEVHLLRQHLNSLPEKTKIFISAVTVGEVQYGAHVGPFNENNDKKHEEIIRILESYPCLSIDKDVADHYYSVLRARLYAQYAPKSKKGQRADKKRIEEWIDPTTSKTLQVQENDVWITALAWTYNLVLVTDDAMSPIKAVAGEEIAFENWIRAAP